MVAVQGWVGRGGGGPVGGWVRGSGVQGWVCRSGGGPRVGGWIGGPGVGRGRWLSRG